MFRVSVVLVICGITGASIFILVKALVGTVSPLQLVGVRVLLAAIMLNVLLLSTGKAPRLNRARLRPAAVLAVFDAAIPYLLIAMAAPHILASTSALLISTMPLFTAVVMSRTDRTAIPTATLIGLAFGAAGVAILAGPTALDFGSSRMLAMLAVLGAAASYAGCAVYSRVPLRDTSPVELSAVKFAIASVMLLPLVAMDRPGAYLHLDGEGWLALFGIGFVATGLARSGYVWVISVAGSVVGSLLTYIVPVATLALGAVFLSERLSAGEVVGAVLVGTSVTSVIFGPGMVRVVRRASRAHSVTPETQESMA